jgi:hypothetical protein
VVARANEEPASGAGWGGKWEGDRAIKVSSVPNLTCRHIIYFVTFVCCIVPSNGRFMWLLNI